MTILLLAEHANQQLSDSTARALSAALQISGPVHVLVAGKNIQPVALAAAGLDGVAKVLLAESDAYAYGLAEPLAELIVSMASSYDVILGAATTSAKNTLPRVAALLDVMQVSEIQEVVSPDTFKRSIYAGNAVQTVRDTDARKVITVRAAAFPRAGSVSEAAPIEAIAVIDGKWPSRFVSEEITVSERPELTAADIVIAGGRAFGSPEKFNAYLTPLAEKLGAAIGASRAAVDAGYAPNDWQVGQTGKIVAPRLYIACGISGAIQHVAGMKDAEVIVAINKDEDAPIFEIATYGLVGDVFDVLPALEKALPG